MNVKELHSEAIRIADEAFIAKFYNKLEESQKLFLKSYLLEKEAALLAKNEAIGEPSVSILLKSSATLALNAGLIDEAERLVCLALSETCPLEIAEELRNLLEEIYFQRHLNLRGLELNSSEIQLVIAGPGIGYGLAKSELVLDKLHTFEQLAFRTAERRAGIPFRTKGKTSKNIKLNFQPYLSVPRAASFAFTIRIGAPTQQLVFDGLDSSVQVIDELFENLSLLNQGKNEDLMTKISDASYLLNFVSLSKELAPDGEEVNLIGLSISRNNATQDLLFTRNRQEISSGQYNELENIPENEKIVELHGRLFAANEIQSNIKLKVEGKGRFSIVVPDGLGDIVKKYWGEQVKIIGKELNNKQLRLIGIDPSEEQ